MPNLKCVAPRLLDCTAPIVLHSLHAEYTGNSNDSVMAAFQKAVSLLMLTSLHSMEGP